MSAPCSPAVRCRSICWCATAARSMSAGSSISGPPGPHRPPHVEDHLVALAQVKPGDAIRGSVFWDLLQRVAKRTLRDLFGEHLKPIGRNAGNGGRQGAGFPGMPGPRRSPAPLVHGALRLPTRPDSHRPRRRAGPGDCRSDGPAALPPRPHDARPPRHPPGRRPPGEGRPGDPRCRTDPALRRLPPRSQGVSLAPGDQSALRGRARLGTRIGPPARPASPAIATDRRSKGGNAATRRKNACGSCCDCGILSCLAGNRSRGSSLPRAHRRGERLRLAVAAGIGPCLSSGCARGVRL